MYSSEEPFTEAPFALAGNYLDYYYKENEILHAVIRSDSKVTICGLYTEDEERIPEGQYQILYDGKGIEFSAELLELCKEKKKLKFLIEFSNGSKEMITIANPY